MKRRLAVILISGALLTAPLLVQPVLAAAPESQAAEPKGGEKAEGDPMLLWKCLNFAMLLGLLGYLVKKNLSPVLAERSVVIREGLAAGEAARAAADARALAVQAKLDGLGLAVEALRADARSDREREAARIRRETDAELSRLSVQAAREIESAGKLARLELQHHAARLAVELATQKIKGRMSGDVQAALMDNFISGLADRTAETSDKSKTT